MSAWQNYQTPAFPTRAAAVVKSDATVFEASAVYIGTAGDVAVMPWDGAAAVTFKGLPAGSMVPVMCKQVMSTNTTASDMVRVY